MEDKVIGHLATCLAFKLHFFSCVFFRDLNSVYIQNIRAEYDIHTIMQNGAFSRVEAVGLGGSPSILHLFLSKRETKASRTGSKHFLQCQDSMSYRFK